MNTFILCLGRMKEITGMIAESNKIPVQNILSGTDDYYSNSHDHIDFLIAAISGESATQYETFFRESLQNVALKILLVVDPKEDMIDCKRYFDSSIKIDTESITNLPFENTLEYAACIINELYRITDTGNFIDADLSDLKKYLFIQKDDVQIAFGSGNGHDIINAIKGQMQNSISGKATNVFISLTVSSENNIDQAEHVFHEIESCSHESVNIVYKLSIDPDLKDEFKVIVFYNDVIINIIDEEASEKNNNEEPVKPNSKKKLIIPIIIVAFLLWIVISMFVTTNNSQVEYDKAYSALDQSASEQTQKVSNYLSSAQTKLNNNDFDGAASDAQAALNIDSANSDAITLSNKITSKKIDNYLSDAETKLNQGDYDNAINDVEAVLKIDSNNSSAKSLYDEIYAQKAEANQIAAEKEKQAVISGAKVYSFKVLDKNPDDFSGQYIKESGQIVQIMEDSKGNTTIRLNITEDEYGIWSDTIMIFYDQKIDVYEDDIVTIWGTIRGSYTYQSQAGWNITLPAVDAVQIQKD